MVLAPPCRTMSRLEPEPAGQPPSPPPKDLKTIKGGFSPVAPLPPPNNRCCPCPILCFSVCSVQISHTRVVSLSEHVAALRLHSLPGKFFSQTNFLLSLPFFLPSPGAFPPLSWFGHRCHDIATNKCPRM